MHVCVYVCMYVCRYVCMYACLYVHTYICTVCTYVCMYGNILFTSIIVTVCSVDIIITDAINITRISRNYNTVGDDMGIKYCKNNGSNFWERKIDKILSILGSALEQEKPPKVAILSPYHTIRPRRHLANNGSSSRSWPAQLVPSTGAILLTVTSQGRQNALQKSRPTHIGQYRHCT